LLAVRLLFLTLARRFEEAYDSVGLGRNTPISRNARAPALHPTRAQVKDRTIRDS
jgi:hypothetical protein